MLKGVSILVDFVVTYCILGQHHSSPLSHYKIIRGLLHLTGTFFFPQLY
jgi:hypothetical protein